MKISVALCTYNGEKYIEEQIDSILNQSVSVDEIIVCDDCSYDSTLTIIEKYNHKKPNLFKVFSNESNLRSNKNFEKAIGLATGDYIFLSDQDDIWRFDKVEKTMNVFNQNPTADGVFSNAGLINDEGRNLFDDKISLWDSVHFPESRLSKPIDLYEILIKKGNYLTGATLCVKKELKDYCFPFDTIENVLLHDEWLALITSQRNKLFYSNEKLISYRIHSNQQVGVGDIIKNPSKINKNPEYLELLLGLKQPKKYKDYKVLSRTLFIQFEKFYLLGKKKKIYLDVAKKLLEEYKKADNGMKKTNRILYYIRKYKDKQKGKRQVKMYHM